MEPCFSFVNRIVELAGAEMFSRTILVQDATAEVIEAYSVTVQVVPVPTVVVVFAVGVVVLTLLDGVEVLEDEIAAF